MSKSTSCYSTLALVVLLSVIIVVAFSSTGIVAPPNLIEIQERRLFDEWTNDVKNNRVALVYFYASWSPVCKEFTREYGKVAKYFSHEGYSESIMITKMDGPNHHQLSRSLKIEGFPYVMLYSHDKVGEFEKYPGELEAESLIAWVKERLHKKMKDDGKKIPKIAKKRGII